MSECMIIIILTILGQSETRPSDGDTSKSKNCNTCVDTQGKSCDKSLQRFERTRYWIPTRSSFTETSGFTFVEATKKCEEFRLTIATLATQGDDAKDLKRATHVTSFDDYWLVLPPDGEEDVKPVVVNRNEELKDNTKMDSKFAYVCQFPDGDECIKESEEEDDGFEEAEEEQVTTTTSATWIEVSKITERVREPKPPPKETPKPKKRKCKSLLFGNRLAIRL